MKQGLIRIFMMTGMVYPFPLFAMSSDQDHSLPSAAAILRAIDQRAIIKAPSKDVVPELLCKGLINPRRRVALFMIQGEIIGQVYEGKKLVSEGPTTKQMAKSGTGATSQTRLSYRSGVLPRGGFSVRIVSEYETFPQRQGTGNVSVRVNGKMTNDTIECYQFPSG